MSEDRTNRPTDKRPGAVRAINGLSTRMIALAALIAFAPVVASFFLTPGAWWTNYPGIIFHLALFALVARLPAPAFARAAGYGWLIVDVSVGVMSLNGVADDITQPLRLGGHIFAGIWLVSTSLGGSRAIQLIGTITGLWLAGFTFVSPVFPIYALGPNALLVLVWLGLIAWQDGTR